MAVTITPLALNGTIKIIRDASANATAENNATDGSATIFAITADSLAGASTNYLKLYNSATAVTVGTTDPDVILMLPGSVTRAFIFRNSLSFSTGLSFACVTTAGTAGTTNPVTTVIVNIVTG